MTLSLPFHHHPPCHNSANSRSKMKGFQSGLQQHSSINTIFTTPITYLFLLLLILLSFPHCHWHNNNTPSHHHHRYPSSNYKSIGSLIAASNIDTSVIVFGDNQRALYGRLSVAKQESHQHDAEKATTPSNNTIYSHHNAEPPFYPAFVNEVGIANDFISVECANLFSLCLTTNGSVFLFGTMPVRQFRETAAPNAYPHVLRFHPAQNDKSIIIEEISVGGYHALFRDSEHQAWLLGSNLYGQLGLRTRIRYFPEPFPFLTMPETAKIKTVKAQGDQSLFLVESEDASWNGLWSTGLGFHAPEKAGSQMWPHTQQQQDPSAPFAAAAPPAFDTPPTPTAVFSPLKVNTSLLNTLSPAAEIDQIGLGTNFFILTDSVKHCAYIVGNPWHGIAESLLLNGSYNQAVSFDPPLCDVTALSVGTQHALFLTKQNKLYSYGANATPQLSPLLVDLSLVTLSSDDAIKHIYAGDHFSTLYTTDADFYLWFTQRNPIASSLKQYVYNSEEHIHFKPHPFYPEGELEQQDLSLQQLNGKYAIPVTASHVLGITQNNKLVVKGANRHLESGFNLENHTISNFKILDSKYFKNGDTVLNIAYLYPGERLKMDTTKHNTINRQVQLKNEGSCLGFALSSRAAQDKTQSRLHFFGCDYGVFVRPVLDISLVPTRIYDGFGGLVIVDEHGKLFVMKSSSLEADFFSGIEHRNLRQILAVEVVHRYNEEKQISAVGVYLLVGFDNSVTTFLDNGESSVPYTLHDIFKLAVWSNMDYQEEIYAISKDQKSVLQLELELHELSEEQNQVKILRSRHGALTQPSIDADELLVDIQVGMDYAVLLTNKSRIFTRGYNHHGALGTTEIPADGFTDEWMQIYPPTEQEEGAPDYDMHYNSMKSTTTTATKDHSATRIISIYTKSYQTLALRQDGRVLAWGSGYALDALKPDIHVDPSFPTPEFLTANGTRSVSMHGEVIFLLKPSLCFGKSPDDYLVCNGAGHCIAEDSCVCFQESVDHECVPLKSEKPFDMYTLYLIAAPVFAVFIAVTACLSIISCCLVYNLWRTHLSKKKKSEELTLLQERFVVDLMEDDITSTHQFRMDSTLHEIQFNELKLEKQIAKGEGGSGALILLATWRDMPVAVKLFRVPDETFLSVFEREVVLYGSLRHPGIACFFGWFNSSNKVGIVTEYCQHGSFADWIDAPKSQRLPLSFMDKVVLLTRVASAMEYLHDKSCLHRDIKSENILIASKTSSKLIDFGLARLYKDNGGNDSRLTKLIGTPKNMSPEASAGQEYDKKCDVWGFGLVVFELVVETKDPWLLNERNPQELLLRLSTDPSFRPDMNRLPKNLSEMDRHWVTNLIRRCLQQFPEDRPSFDELVKEMKGYANIPLDDEE